MLDPRFACPECGRAPVLSDHDWTVINKERKGTLPPGLPVTCPNAHTWRPPDRWISDTAVKVTRASAEDVEQLWARR